MKESEFTHAGTICWFCRNERHEDCMVEIPVEHGKNDGPHDCTFNIEVIYCVCKCRNV